jgi:hypothetical protein
VVGLITLIRRTYFSGIELERTEFEARKSAIENEMSSIAIDAFFGKARAVRRFASLQAELGEVKHRIDRLERDCQEESQDACQA